MFRQRWLAGLAATATVAGLTIVSFTGAAGASPSPQWVRLAGSAAPFTSSSRAIGPVNGAVRLSVQVWLKPDLAAAAKYATEVSTPGNAMFHHYLSPAAFTARFGGSKAAAAKVESWLRGQGFAAVHTDAQRNYVRATASVNTINAAFKVQLTNYRSSNGVSAGRYTLRSNDRPVTVPAALAGSVLGVTGLDNAAVELPLERPSDLAHSPNLAAAEAQAAKAPSAPCSHWYGQHFAPNLPKKFGTRNFPTEVCGYHAAQLRAAYEMNFRATGKGQTVALVELGLTPEMFLTLKDYAAHMHMPKPSTTRYAELSLGNNSCGDPFFIEEQLDVEASYDMAPHANQLVVGGDACNNGDFGLQGLFNADIALLNGNGHHPLASVASNSWEGADEEQPPTNTQIETSFLLRAAAEGVGMYFSAGDGSGVLSPSDSPYAISVGGTTLGIGKDRNRLFETGWSTGQYFLTRDNRWTLLGEQGASGGGPSLLWAQPRYQKGVVPTKLATAQGNRPGRVRSAPDISADADPFTGFAVGLLNQVSPNKPPVYIQIDIGGTSEAAPLVAGIVTAAQQGQRRSFGFIDPALYRLAGTAALHDSLPVTRHTPREFHGVSCDQFTCGFQTLVQFDDQNPNMFGYFGQVTLPGYDNMTGIGTPRGQAFIRALRAQES